MDVELSDTEQKAYDFIKDAKQPLPIRDMPHNLQGAVGKLKAQGLVEIYREQTPVSKHGFTSMKRTNCVRIKIEIYEAERDRMVQKSKEAVGNNE